MRTGKRKAPRLEDLPEFFNIKDMDGLFPIHLSTLYRMVDRQEIPAMHMGARIVIRKEALVQWMDSDAGKRLLGRGSNASQELLFVKE